MDFIFVVGLMIVAAVVVSVILLQSRRSRRDSDTPPRVVTQNLDYSILGQRPEIITEDDPDAQSSP